MNEQTARIIAGAISAAGPVGGNPAAWEHKVESHVARVAAMYEEQSRVAKRAEAMDNAHIFSGTYLGQRLEESSQRLIVRFDSGKVDPKTQENVIEEIRTDRIDGETGRAVKQILDRLQPGDEVLCWRVNEPMRDDPMKNVRVLYHAKRIRAAKNAEAAPRREPQAQQVGSTRPPAPRPAPSPATPSVGGGVPPTREGQPNPVPEHVIAVRQRLAGLTSRKRGQAAVRCREAGIPNFVEPTIDQVDQVLTIIQAVEQEP